MKILFILPESNEIVFPIGMAMVAARARVEGHCVSTLDIGAYRLSRENVTDVLRRAQFDVAAVGGVITQFRYMEWLAEEIRREKPGAKVVLGGPAATSAAEYFLRNDCVDAVIAGEAEFSFSKYVKAVENGESGESIPGVMLPGCGGAPPVFHENLDDLPLPAWDLFPVEIYLGRPAYSVLQGYGMNLVTKRGCPFDCIFCSRLRTRKVRLHSIDRTMEEIRFLRKRYEIDNLVFFDDNFAAVPSHADALCEAIIKYGKNIRWSCGIRPDFADYGLLEKFRRAGCGVINLGLESGSPRILRNLNKEMDLSMVKETVRRIRDLGMLVTYNFLFGGPGETLDTIQETLRFSKECGLPVDRFSYLTPVPGTALWKLALERGAIGDPLDYLRNRLDFHSPSVNLTDISTSVLKKAVGFIQREAGDDSLNNPIRHENRLKLLGVEFTKKTIERALLRQEYPACCFSHGARRAPHRRISFDPRITLSSDMEAARRLVGRIKSIGNEITFRGAEPTLSPAFGEILRLPVLRQFWQVRLETDGRKLSDRDYLTRLLDGGVNEFTVELCGPDADLHERHTGEEGGFGRTARGIENVLSAGRPAMVSIPLTRMNIGALEKFPARLGEMGVSLARILYDPHADAYAPAEIFPDPATLMAGLRDSLPEFAGRGVRIRVDGVPMCLLGKNAEYYRPPDVPRWIGTTDPPVMNHSGWIAGRQGPKCAECARRFACEGVSPGQIEIFGWDGIEPIEE